MATREILQFAQAGGANVLSQAAYAALVAILADGYPAGILDSNLLNKTLRQSNFMAVGVAEFLVNQGISVPDDGDVVTLAANLESAINLLIAAGITGVTAGSILFFPANAAPSGYLKANGSLVLRATYADLWAYAQASGNIAINDGAWTAGQFSPGDGATTFRIPDARGEFPRFWDDAAGIDAGRAIGSNQADAFQGHWHNTAISTGGSGSGASGNTTGYSGIAREPIDDGVNGVPRIAAETRPRNIAWLGCIKY